MESDWNNFNSNVEFIRQLSFLHNIRFYPKDLYEYVTYRYPI